MTTLVITECGPGASVQDTGRFGYRNLGVSTAGAMDRRTLAQANTLVGNSPDTAAIEIPLLGAAFRVSGGPILVAADGPGTTLTVSGYPVPVQSSIKVANGDTVRVGPPQKGVYSYLAVSGGIQSIPVLGSRSFHRRSGIGGNILSPGDHLPCLKSADDTALFFPEGISHGSDDSFRILPGPQVNMFDAIAWSRLVSERYQINPRSDRMGLRLDGPSLESKKGYDIISDGVVPGCIQVPGDGSLIILGRDCQTTGGYPKIATIISADLDRLAQVPVGRSVRFHTVSEEVAIEAAHNAMQWCSSLKSVARPIGCSTSNLLSHNLIGGVTKGDDL